jgi:hypothetical protein
MKQRINESRNEPTEPTKKGNPFNESLNQWAGESVNKWNNESMNP